MADALKIGTDWTDEELDAIVAEYFDMLADELAGRSYVKAHRAAALMQKIGRTHRSVEFKHMNISAVLSELALPTIRGYKAKPNYQSAIFPAIERFLVANPAAFELSEARFSMQESHALFEEAPPVLRNLEPRPLGLERLVRKFDPVERDARNRTLGRAGEELVFQMERKRLGEQDRSDLARKVRWVAAEDGDGAGYDVLSFEPDGREKLIEVKTTCGAQRTPFFISRNEASLAEERPKEFCLYRLYEFRKFPRMFQLRPPLTHSLLLVPENYRASFG